MTNQEFAEECRQRRVDYDTLYEPRATPMWMRKAEEDVKRLAVEGLRAAVRGTTRQYVERPDLLEEVDHLLPHLDRDVALRRVVDSRVHYRPTVWSLANCQEPVNLIAAERALRILGRLERRFQRRVEIMNAERERE